ncbi:MAG: Tol-Pal system beta propeller repeat protein TolB [Gammaproteobacteria bacterium]|nr:Tol-Pal system beta propeller repeat protein TolB [Gammaproteobacteria bacterium]
MIQQPYFFIALALILFSSGSFARLNIEITGGLESGIPIAIVPFSWQGKGALPEDIAAIVEADLARTGLFTATSRDKMPATPHSGKDIEFQQWREIATDNLVVGRLIEDMRQNGASFLVEFQLFDVYRGRQLSGFSIQANHSTLRRTGHQISDIIYQQLTGERGSFNTHICYIMAEDVTTEKRRYRLAVADSDGYNEQIILTSSQPLMSPAWSPDGKQLAYVSFETGRSIIYIQELSSGKRREVSSQRGINSAPRWSPDGRYLTLALSRDGNSEIYLMEIATGELQRVTHSYAIDTEPAWHPDGRSLIFTSDRGGGPQIYSVAIDPESKTAQRPQRLTYEGKYNARASYSPDGKLLTYIHSDSGKYRVAVQDLESGTMRVLTETQLDESPGFSANGTMIIYATEQNHRGVLESVSVDGKVHSRLHLQKGDVREPSWSPFLNK